MSETASEHSLTGTLWTDWIGPYDTSWHQTEIKVGFTPTHGDVFPLLAVYSTLTYLPGGFYVKCRISDLRPGIMEIEYRLTIMSEYSLKIRFFWEAISKRRTFSSLGLGTQIR